MRQPMCRTESQSALSTFPPGDIPWLPRQRTALSGTGTYTDAKSDQSFQVLSIHNVHVSRVPGTKASVITPWTESRIAAHQNVR